MPVDPAKLLKKLKAHHPFPVTFTVTGAVYTPEQVRAAVDEAKKAVDAQMSAAKVLEFVLGIASKMGAIV